MGEIISTIAIIGGMLMVLGIGILLGMRSRPLPRRISVPSSLSDDTYRMHLQLQEDKRKEEEIKTVAYRLFKEYVDAETIEIGGEKFKNCITFIPPLKIYKIYHHETARYKDVNCGDLMKEHYNKLKEGYDK